VMLKGRSRDVRKFADAISAERGVRHGQLNLVTVEVGHPSRHVHSHLTPNH
jgi:CopG family nickel-responsive transcriptional regulator